MLTSFDTACRAEVHLRLSFQLCPSVNLLCFSERKYGRANIFYWRLCTREKIWLKKSVQMGFSWLGVIRGIWRLVGSRVPHGHLLNPEKVYLSCSKVHDSLNINFECWFWCQKIEKFKPLFLGDKISGSLIENWNSLAANTGIQSQIWKESVNVL